MANDASRSDGKPEREDETVRRCAELMNVSLDELGVETAVCLWRDGLDLVDAIKAADGIENPPS
jgi:uncharacterized protein (UPF0210 family)